MEGESKTDENKGGDDVEEQVGKSEGEESALLARLVMALKHKEQLLAVRSNNPLEFIITNYTQSQHCCLLKYDSGGILREKRD